MSAFFDRAMEGKTLTPLSALAHADRVNPDRDPAVTERIVADLIARDHALAVRRARAAFDRSRRSGQASVWVERGADGMCGVFRDSAWSGLTRLTFTEAFRVAWALDRDADLRVDRFGAAGPHGKLP